MKFVNILLRLFAEIFTYKISHFVLLHLALPSSMPPANVPLSKAVYMGQLLIPVTQLCSFYTFQSVFFFWQVESVVCIVSRFSRVRLFATLWIVAWEAPLTMGFSSKNTGVGWHALLLGIFLIQGSNAVSFVSCIGRWHSLPLAPSGKPQEAWCLGLKSVFRQNLLGVFVHFVRPHLPHL